MGTVTGKPTFQLKIDILQGNRSGLFHKPLSGQKEREGVVKRDFRDNQMQGMALDWILVHSGWEELALAKGGHLTMAWILNSNC